MGGQDGSNLGLYRSIEAQQNNVVSLIKNPVYKDGVNCCSMAFNHFDLHNRAIKFLFLDHFFAHVGWCILDNDW